ncbi:MAG: restriction endonuclease [bacterium]|nr:restriction endonuclease [bacterium]
MQLNWTEILIKTIEISIINWWPVWLFITMIFLFGSALKIIEYRKLARSGIYEIDKMSGKEFEDLLVVLFRRMCYIVTHTGRSTGDYGVDLVIEKDGIKTAVQAKRHKRLIGEDAVREVFSGMVMYKCTKALVVTNSRYTYQATKLAKSNKVILWNRTDLINKLLSN